MMREATDEEGRAFHEAQARELAPELFAEWEGGMDEMAMTVSAQQEILRRLKEIDAMASRAEAEYVRLRGLLLEYGRH